MNHKLFLTAVAVLAVASCVGCNDDNETARLCQPKCLDEYMRVSCSADDQEIIEMCDYGCEKGLCVKRVIPDSPTPDKPGTPDLTADDDGDGILTHIETGTCLDPYQDDTDNDGVKDGDEDLNRNGIYEPLFGETNPCDPLSRPANDEIKVKNMTCNPEIMKTGETIELDTFSLVPFKNTEYRDTDDYVGFRHNELDVVGFYGMAEGFTLDHILKTAFPLNESILESSSIQAFPHASWLQNEAFDKALVELPNHVIDRYKVTINMGNVQTLEDLQQSLESRLFGPVVIFSENTMTFCKSDNADDNQKAILYLARAAYPGENGNQYLYSAAITCRNNMASADMDAIQIQNIMDDSISGGMVAPKNISKNDSYAAFEHFVCQGEKFTIISSVIDFLWVIDNSGSMGDELKHLARDIDAVSERLNAIGVDYRFAVTTTDAYLIDEQGTIEDGKYTYDTNQAVTYMPYDENYQPIINAYINGLGVRTTKHSLPCMLGPEQSDIFKDNIYKFSTTTVNNACKDNLNICGKGYEDGFKSGALALERLSLDIDKPKPDDISDEWWNNFVLTKKHLAYQHYFDDSLCINNEQAELCQNMRNACQMRPDALKYIIFVSDEDSRQFKEDAIVSKYKTHLNGCLTGYKLEVSDISDVYSMMTGIYSADKHCNPSLSDYKERLSEWLNRQEDSHSMTLENMSLEDIKAAYPEYYHMLSYYLEQYRKYAGTGNIIAHALVGDAGLHQGGRCSPLASCAPEDCTDYNPQGKCVICGIDDDKWNYHDATATDGADFGLSYIHLARFLSTTYRDQNGVIQTDGIEGSFSSICKTDYLIDLSEITSIGLGGRLKPVVLKGYPIPNTIRVSIMQNGTAVELERNNGWRYHAQENKIIFTGHEEFLDGADIAVSYNIWTHSR